MVCPTGPVCKKFGHSRRLAGFRRGEFRCLADNRISALAQVRPKVTDGVDTIGDRPYRECLGMDLSILNLFPRTGSRYRCTRLGADSVGGCECGAVPVASR